MMAAAANATSAVLGTEVEIAPPDTRVLTSLETALEAHDDAAHVTSGVFTVFGQPCRLVQLVPNAFVMRMTKALDELGAEYLGDQAPLAIDGSSGLDESLRGVQVRVWAELGRRRMPIGFRPRRVQGIDAEGYRGTAIVASNAAALWLGTATTFDVEGSDGTLHTMAVTNRVGESGGLVGAPPAVLP